MISRPSASGPPLYALVLAGGRSTRMQRDKAMLPYAGRTQLERAVELIEPFVERVYISVRPDQIDDPLRARFAQIVDSGETAGPIAGILAAQSRHPEAAWLVLACDLPLLDAETLERLLASRQPGRQATAYRSSHDGLPEPLCAIYEPASREALRDHVAAGYDCPRKFLIRADTALLEQPEPGALDNVNTPNEYGSALSRVLRSAGAPADGAAVVRPAESGAAVARQIKVQYYALLREQAGRSAETVSTGARTPRELYEELRRRHPFSLAPEMLRVAVNAEFGDWSQPLDEGDAVVFIPPVAGG
jgi:molybdopterin-guanine dinucleotide biosynthesis protein A/molybdopterin converting factor small subunit